MSDTLVLHLLPEGAVYQAVLTFLNRTAVTAPYDPALSPVTAIKHEETVLLLHTEPEEGSEFEAQTEAAWYDAYKHDWAVHWVGQDGYHHVFPEPLVVEQTEAAPKKKRAAPATPRKKKETPAPEPVVETPAPQESPVEATESHQEATKPPSWQDEADNYLRVIQEAVGGLRELIRKIP